jgi:hypothetical protein
MKKVIWLGIVMLAIALQHSADASKQYMTYDSMEDARAYQYDFGYDPLPRESYTISYQRHDNHEDATVHFLSDPKSIEYCVRATCSQCSYFHKDHPLKVCLPKSRADLILYKQTRRSKFNGTVIVYPLFWRHFPTNLTAGHTEAVESLKGLLLQQPGGCYKTERSNANASILPGEEFIEMRWTCDIATMTYCYQPSSGSPEQVCRQVTIKPDEKIQVITPAAASGSLKVYAKLN